MAKPTQVVSVGPDIHVQGGISRVIEMISARIPAHVRFRHVPTFTRYTGAEGIDPSQRGSRLGQSLVYVRAAAKILKAAVGRRTVFHVHFAGHGSLIRKGLLCGVLRVLRCTYAVHSHAAETSLFHRWMPQLGRRLLLWGLTGADRVIVLTQFWRDYYMSLLGLPASRLLLLPNPADLPQAVPDRLHHGALKLLFLGRVGERKGAFDLIRAFAQLPDDVRSNCSLTLAGDGEVDVAASHAAQSGCSERVIIRGWVSANEVEALLRDSDVLLLPSHAEGMSMALIEAMSWALAVVTTNAGGAQAFLEHGHNSILVAPGDVEGISRAILELHRDPHMRVTLGTAARTTVSHFSIESYMTKLTTLYEELAALRIGALGTAPTSEDNTRPIMHHPTENAAGVKLDRPQYPREGTT
jgi:glycosyltransferase involved in cell wall biosynthesis